MTMNPYRRRDTWPTLIHLSKQTTFDDRIISQTNLNDSIHSYGHCHVRMSGHTDIVLSSTGTDNIQRTSLDCNVRRMRDKKQKIERHETPWNNCSCCPQRSLAKTKSVCTCKHEYKIPNSNGNKNLYPRYYTIPNIFYIFHPPDNVHMNMISYMPSYYYRGELPRSTMMPHVGLLFCNHPDKLNYPSYQSSRQLSIKNESHQSPHMDILIENNSPERMIENNYEFCDRVKVCFLELKKLFDYNIGKIKDRITQIIVRVKCILDNKIENIKARTAPIIEKVKNKLSPITRLLPVIISVVAIVLGLSDQSTDGTSTYKICTAECRCEYVVAGSFSSCQAPSDVCGSGWINGTSVNNYCYQDFGGEEHCKSKQTWEVPEICKCYWEESYFPSADGTCKAPKGTCFDLEYGGKPYFEYCLYNGNNSKDDCEGLATLTHPDSNLLQQRHPYWCRLSLGFFIGPSILNNLILLISLLYNFNYKQYFITAGVSSMVNIHWSKVFLLLSAMAIIQILPYLCLFLKLMTLWRIYTKRIYENSHSNDLKSITTKMNVVFSFTEDLPQLTLQMFVFLQAVLFKDVGILDEISWLVILGLVTSLLSLSKNYTEYCMSLSNASTSPVVTFTTAFMAAGGRVLISCLMTVIYDDFNYIEDNSATWRIFLPVLTTIALQIVLLFAKICFTFYRQLFAHNSLFLNQNINSSEFEEVEMKVRKSTQCSNDSSLNETNTLSKQDISMYQKLVCQLSKAVIRIRSLLFSLTSNGHSLLGLWSSTSYATWALWLRMHFLGRFLYYPEKFVEVSKTALTFAMLSYSINSILTLTNYQQRKECLLASVIFIIYPTYLYITAKLQINNVWYDIYVYDGRFDEVIQMLNPIVAVAGLVMFINIIAVVNIKGKSRNISSEDHDIV